VDVLGDALADRYEFALDTVLDDPGVDIALVLLTPQAMTQATETAQAMARINKAKPGKPVMACFMGAAKLAEGLAVLRDNNIPQYESPENAVKAIKVFADYAAWRREPPRVIKPLKADKAAARAILQAHLDKGLREVGETEAKKVLEAYGFVVPKSALANSADEAAAAAAAIGFPVVMKINSPDISHKSDVGGVKVNLADAKAVRDAYTGMMTQIPQKMPKAKLEGVSIQEMCKRSHEIIMGVNRDKMGAMIMFGLGGILVEVLKDVTFALAPLSEHDARHMVESTRTYKILQGVRGQPGADLDAVVQALLRLSQLVSDFPEIKELDINPFMAGQSGQVSVAVDARISVEK
jgi:acetyltransferase